ncbi:MAG: outer membrane lipoprotein-sorting protein [Spirochaetes bacterium]|nr:outer membrane lipoprotein-sorting protein [Spirochaetota bacterium]
MKLKSMIFFWALFILQNAFSQDALTIIRKLDNNEVFNAIQYEGDMTIFITGKKIIKTFTSYAKGRLNYYIEFTNPDDLGTKYMKKDGNLFYYSDDTEKVIPITGHMLRESMMGSDLSYEDAIENETLESQYNAKIIDQIKFDSDTKFKGKDVWLLELNAKKKTVSYPKELIWVDKETFAALKIERFALSGAKLKEFLLLDAEWIGNKYFATEMQIKDLLRKDSRTLFKMKNIKMNVQIPDDAFSLKRLSR